MFFSFNDGVTKIVRAEATRINCLEKEVFELKKALKGPFIVFYSKLFGGVGRGVVYLFKIVFICTSPFKWAGDRVADRDERGANRWRMNEVNQRPCRGHIYRAYFMLHGPVN
jgi:hypothetical protein